jgi:serine/threonine protein kinase
MFVTCMSYNSFKAMEQKQGELSMDSELPNGSDRFSPYLEPGTALATGATLNIFISYRYSTETFSERVLQLAKDLRLFSFNVQIDQRFLAFGEDIKQFMDIVIAEADVMLLIVTHELNQALNSKGLEGAGVRYEVQLALTELTQRSNFRVIPVLLEDVRPVAPISNMKAVDLSKPEQYRQSVAELAAELAMLSTATKNRTLERRYRIDTLLQYRGITGIYSGYDMALDTEVEIYLVLVSSVNPTILQQYSRVARARSKSYSPFLLNYRDSALLAQQWMLVTEHFSGTNLDILFSTKRAPVEIAVQCCYQICLGLLELHGAGILHCGLVARVVRLGHNGRHTAIKIIDFEFATLAAEAASYANEIEGYGFALPPERWKGTVATEQSDIYQLGHLLLWMITGKKLAWPETFLWLSMHGLQNSSDYLPLNQIKPGSLVDLMLEGFGGVSKYQKMLYQLCAETIERFTAYDPPTRPTTEQALLMLLELDANPIGYSERLDEFFLASS